MECIKSNWNSLQPEYLSVPDVEKYYDRLQTPLECTTLCEVNRQKGCQESKNLREPDPEILTTGVITESNI